MKYPEYLKQSDAIGITACSMGVLDKLDQYKETVNYFIDKGYNIVETKNVKTDGMVSSSSEERAKQLIDLYNNDDVKLVSVARGGDFLFDMLPYVDFDVIRSKVKWLSGSSDPTSLLFYITTKLDIATIYSPCNMTGFSDEISEYHENFVDIIEGKLNKQYKFEKCESKFHADTFDQDNEWENLNGDVDEEGVLIGGCIDVLKDIIGTKYDNVKEFIKKYKEHGFIWYFDIFSMSKEVFYNTLLQFKYAGWFDNAKAIVFGKVAFPNGFIDLSYEELVCMALPDIKVVFNFDIGHVKPSFTMINGKYVRLISNMSEGSLEFLKNIL